MSKLLENVKEHLDIPAFASDMLDEVLEPALDKIVADTANPFDDAIKAALYPPLEAELKKLIAEKWAELGS